MALVEVVTTADTTADEALRLAGSLEDASEHPIARAIASGARERGIALAAVESFASTQGLGVQGVVDSHAVVAGRESFFDDWSLTLPHDIQAAKDAAETAGRTPILAGGEGKARAGLVVYESIKNGR